MIPIRLQNCTLGIFGLKSWEAARPLNAQVKAMNDPRNNISVESRGWNKAQGVAEYVFNNSTAQFPNPATPAFIPRPDVTVVESREPVQWAPSGNGLMGRISGPWPPAKESEPWTANVNGQPAEMNRQWPPCDDVLPSISKGQWPVNRNLEPATVNGQRSDTENAQRANADGQWSASGNVQQANGQWSVSRNAQPGDENRQWSAAGMGRSTCTNGQWSAKENGPPKNGPPTFAARQTEERENDRWSNPASSALVPKSGLARSDPDKSLQGLDRQNDQWPKPRSAECVQRVEQVVVNRTGYRLIAKHNYAANPNSPFGAGAELGFKQAEQLTKIGEHPEQELWWLAKNENGEQGYVPSTYMMVIEDNGTLPWLQNRVVEEKEEEEVALAKPLEPYRSAYGRGSTAASKYNCELCGRNFNGPQPYNAHMVSRAHREAVEAHQGYA